MLLDQMQEFIDKYHLIRWGIGGIVTATVLVLVFKNVNGMWRGQKMKSLSKKSKKSVDQYRMEQAEKDN